MFGKKSKPQLIRGVTHPSSNSLTHETNLTPFNELQQAINRLDILTKEVCTAFIGQVLNDQSSPSNWKTVSETDTGGKRNNLLHTPTDSYDNRESSTTFYAMFIPFEEKEQEEMIEILRRIAELVVQGEKRASMHMSSSSSSPLELKNNSSQDDFFITSSADNPNAIFEYFCEVNGLAKLVNIITGLVFQQELGVDDNSLMGLINKDEYTKSLSSSLGGKSNANHNGTDDTNKVENNDIVTNIDINDAEIQKDMSKVKKCSVRLLPPLSIATQAVQSISILIQNVTRPTSLYFLLSSNRVNDLIDLPLDLYISAVANSIYPEKLQGIKSLDGKAGENQNLSTSKDSIWNNIEQSADMAELRTHMISFLKSLAMRMTSETLQFFLIFKNQTNDRSDYDHKDDQHDSKIIDKVDSVEFPLYARALDFCSSTTEDNLIRITAMNVCLNTLRLTTILNQDDHQNDASTTQGESRSSKVESKKIFSGTLDFEGGVQINTSPSSSSFEHSPTEIPPASLHTAKPLPFRERLALAEYVCVPSRVEMLMSPIFMKLAKLCGSIEESIRSIDEVDRSLSTSLAAALDAHTTAFNRKKVMEKRNKQNKNKAEIGIDQTLLDIDEQSRLADDMVEINNLRNLRGRLVRTLKNHIADLHDEFLLLEDVLMVGLVPLNEQVIEMMFATVVYPLLLQPLHLHMQHHQASSNNNDDLLQGMLNDNSQSLGDKMTLRSAEADSSLAKTALVVLSYAFNLISHRPTRNMLLTALCHPIGPEASDGFITTEFPNVVGSDANGNLQIRVDPPSMSKADSTPKADNNFDCYSFSSKAENMDKVFDVRESSSREKCNFVLCPALSQIFRGSMGGSLPETFLTRPNPYRRALLACLSGTDGMSPLQSISVHVMNVIIKSYHVDVLNSILFRVNMASTSDEKVDLSSIKQEKRELNVNDTNIVEVVASLCVSLITASIGLNGMWNLKFNKVAAHAIICASIVNKVAKTAALKLVDHRRLQIASFLSQFPARLVNGIIDLKSISDANKASSDLEHRINVIMDRIFFDSFCETDKCVLEYFIRKKSKGCDYKPNGSGSVPVMQSSYIDDICSHICTDSFVVENLLSHQNEDISYRCGSSSAVTYLQLDAFTKILKHSLPSNNVHTCCDILDLSTYNPGIIEYTSQNGQRLLYSNISSSLHKILFEEEGSDKEMGIGTEKNDFFSNPETLASLNSASKQSFNNFIPQKGSIVALVGRAAFPCVCEVRKECDSLFTDKKACVIADGVKWQSLYLVLAGNYFLLAEPAKGDSGGNGRVITACRLSSLHAEKDSRVEIENASPARRILLTHASTNPESPDVFTPIIEKGNNLLPHQTVISSENNVKKRDRDVVRMTRSHMDLWFEDEVASSKAFKALCSKIARARSRRGQLIREYLAHDDRNRFSSLLHHQSK